jgi:hypothetical protein
VRGRPQSHDLPQNAQFAGVISIVVGDNVVRPPME